MSKEQTFWDFIKGVVVTKQMLSAVLSPDQIGTHTVELDPKLHKELNGVLQKMVEIAIRGVTIKPIPLWELKKIHKQFGVLRKAIIRVDVECGDMVIPGDHPPEVAITIWIAIQREAIEQGQLQNRELPAWLNTLESLVMRYYKNLRPRYTPSKQEKPGFSMVTFMYALMKCIDDEFKALGNEPDGNVENRDQTNGLGTKKYRGGAKVKVHQHQFYKSLLEIVVCIFDMLESGVGRIVPNQSFDKVDDIKCLLKYRNREQRFIFQFFSDFRNLLKCYSPVASDHDAWMLIDEPKAEILALFTIPKGRVLASRLQKAKNWLPLEEFRNGDRSPEFKAFQLALSKKCKIR